MTDIVDNNHEDTESLYDDHMYGLYYYVQGREFLEAKKYNDAFKMFRKAAVMNNKEAMFALGFMYYRKNLGVKKSYSDAFYWYKKSAKLGHVTAMNEVGVMYEHGIGTKTNNEKALYWFRRSSELGDEDGMCNLGVMYHFGLGLNVDYRKAAYWFQKASDLGHKSATNSLAFLYETGRGVVKDVVKAFQLYESVAMHEEFAQVNLGRCYECGIGVEENKEVAMNWYEELLKNGRGENLFQIAQYYAMGTEIIEGDIERALLFFQMAKKKGVGEAQSYIRNIEHALLIARNFVKMKEIVEEEKLCDCMFVFQEKE